MSYVPGEGQKTEREEREERRSQSMCHQLAVGHHYYDLEPIQNVVVFFSLLSLLFFFSSSLLGWGVYDFSVWLIKNSVDNLLGYYIYELPTQKSSLVQQYIIYNQIFWSFPYFSLVSLLQHREFLVPLVSFQQRSARL